mmetsp:Transcript_23084/g.66277  ORF Transcript_23084/g.66277 Transcript_23084/m.66277 type:complete len:254 (-) Transcript_23084:282-1043(-)
MRDMQMSRIFSCGNLPWRCVAQWVTTSVARAMLGPNSRATTAVNSLTEVLGRPPPIRAQASNSFMAGVTPPLAIATEKRFATSSIALRSDMAVWMRSRQAHLAGHPLATTSSILTCRSFSAWNLRPASSVQLAPAAGSGFPASPPAPRSCCKQLQRSGHSARSCPMRFATAAMPAPEKSPRWWATVSENLCAAQGEHRNGKGSSASSDTGDPAGHAAGGGNCKSCGMRTNISAMRCATTSRPRSGLSRSSWPS